VYPRTPDFERDVVCLLGLPVDAVDLELVTHRIREAALRREPLLLTTVNVNLLVAAQADPAFRQSLIGSDLCVADGMPLVWVARCLGLPVRERVAGSDLFERLLRPAARPLRVFLFGGPDGVASAAGERINRIGGGVECVGSESPGFAGVEEMSTPSLLARIEAARPDFVVLSVGARKSHQWIDLNRVRLQAPIFSYLGAVVNFMAGTVRRAPRWMRFLGLEWLWRILQEPGLLRRYAADGLAFGRLLLGCVLPLWWHGLWSKRGGVALQIEEHRTPSGVELCLSGTCRKECLGPLRRTLARVCDELVPVKVDLTASPRLDASTVALLLLLHQHRQLRGLAISFASSHGTRRQLLWFNATQLIV
jgi:N-acetylglucosaminyldiphosphoundecaprenol N-acetyl-beta-D-mannosaminyltransferase